MQQQDGVSLNGHGEKVDPLAKHAAPTAKELDDHQSVLDTSRSVLNTSRSVLAPSEHKEKKSKSLTKSPSSDTPKTGVFHSLTFENIDEYKLTHQELSWLYRLANEGRKNSILKPFISLIENHRAERDAATEKKEKEAARKTINERGITDHMIEFALQGDPVEHLNAYIKRTMAAFDEATTPQEKQTIASNLTLLSMSFFIKAKKDPLPAENAALLNYVHLMLDMALKTGVHFTPQALSYLMATERDHLYTEISQSIEKYHADRNERIRAHLEAHKMNSEGSALRPLSSFMSNVSSRIDPKLKAEYRQYEKEYQAAKDKRYLAAIPEQKTDDFLHDARILTVTPDIRKQYRDTRAQLLHLNKKKSTTIENAIDALSSRLITSPQEKDAIAENVSRFDHFILSLQVEELSAPMADSKVAIRHTSTTPEGSTLPIFQPKNDRFNALKRQYHNLLLNLSLRGATLNPKQKAFITEGHFLSDRPTPEVFMMRAKDKEAYDNQRAYYGELAKLKDIALHVPPQTLTPNEWISRPDPSAETAKAALRDILFVPWMFNNPSDDEMEAAFKILLRIAKTGVPIPKELRLPPSLLDSLEKMGFSLGLASKKESNEASLQDISILSLLNLGPDDQHTTSLSKRLNIIIAHITSLPYTPAIVRFIHNTLGFELVGNRSITRRPEQKAEDKVDCEARVPNEKPVDTSHPLSTILYSKKYRSLGSLFGTTSPQKHAGAQLLIAHAKGKEEKALTAKLKTEKEINKQRQDFRSLFDNSIGHPPQHNAAWGMLLRGEAPTDSIVSTDKSFIAFLKARLADTTMDANVKQVFPRTLFSLNELKLFHIIPSIQCAMKDTAFKLELGNMQTQLRVTVQEEAMVKQARELNEIRINNEVLPRLAILESDENLQGDAKKKEIDGRPMRMLGVLRNQKGATARSIVPNEYPTLSAFVSKFLTIKDELKLPDPLTNPDHEAFNTSEADIAEVCAQLLAKQTKEGQTEPEKDAVEARINKTALTIAAAQKRQAVLFTHQQRYPAEFMLYQVRKFLGEKFNTASTADCQREILKLISPWMLHDKTFTTMLIDTMIRLGMFDEAIALVSDSNIGPSSTTDAFDTHFIELMGLKSGLTRETQQLFANVSDRINEKFQSIYGALSIAERTRTLQNMADQNNVAGLVVQGKQGDEKLTLEAKNEQRLLASIYDPLKDKESSNLDWLQHAKFVLKSPAMEALLLKEPKPEELLSQFSKRYENIFNQIVQELLTSGVTVESKPKEKAAWHKKYEKLVILQVFDQTRLLDAHPKKDVLIKMSFAIKGEQTLLSGNRNNPWTRNSALETHRQLLKGAVKRNHEAKKTAKSGDSQAKTPAVSKTPSPKHQPKRLPPPLNPVPSDNGGGLNLSFLSNMPVLNGNTELSRDSNTPPNQPSPK